LEGADVGLEADAFASVDDAVVVGRGELVREQEQGFPRAWFKLAGLR